MQIYSIGHSTRPIGELIELLYANGVHLLADIRTIPRSRRNPQFEQEALQQSLEAAGIRYAHLAALGGLRRARADSPNTGWRNAAFRGYADYMLTPEFTAGLEQLLGLAEAETSVAMMCA